MTESCEHADSKSQLSFKEVTELTNSIYGFKVASAKELNSYADQSFHITVTNGETNSENSQPNQQEYILKIFNSFDSESHSAHILAQIRFSEHLRSRGFPSPGVVRTKDRTFTGETRCGDDSKLHMVALFEFMEGNLLTKADITEAIAYQGGQLLAELHNNVEGYTDENLIRENFNWSLSSLFSLRSHADLMKDEESKSIILEVLDKWDEIQHDLALTPKGPIHGDFNETNIFFKEVEDTKVIVGVIDFNDSHFNHTVFDVAIYMMYMMTCCHEANPDEIAGFCFRGYLSLRTLQQSELDVLYYCIAGRLVQSLLLGLYYYSVRKDPYLLITQKGGQKVLKDLWKKQPCDVLKNWLK